MTSHFHLLVEVEDNVLARAMHAINLPYARHHNRRYSLRGHVQHWRYDSRRIEDETDLIGTFKYIANNPVEAGLCSAPEAWPWSSYAGTIGLTELPSFVRPARVLACYDWPRVDPQAALHADVTGS